MFIVYIVVRLYNVILFDWLFEFEKFDVGVN